MKSAHAKMKQVLGNKISQIGKCIGMKLDFVNLVNSSLPAAFHCFHAFTNTMTVRDF